MAQIGNHFSQPDTTFNPSIPANVASADDPLTLISSTVQPIQPWYWRKLPLCDRSGSQVFKTLFLQTTSKQIPVATLLESPGNSTHLARYSLCAGSPRIYKGQFQLWTPPIGNSLGFLRRLLALAPSQSTLLNSMLPPELPFTGGWLGWLGYDVAWEIEQLPQYNSDPLPFPIAYWYEPECFAILDHQQQILWLAASDDSQLDRMESQLEDSQRENYNPLNTLSTTPITPIFQMTKQEYITLVQQAKKYIQAGDIFQTNLSLRFETHTPCDSWSIYQALQQINPSPFASYWQTPWGAMISCSPERLIQRSGQKVQTRPIAGTRCRGMNLDHDQQLEAELIANLKERAEHIMLVDLERNDLGRVCQWGSVKVDEFLTIERYSHVMHLVSNIVGTLHPNFDSIDLIRGVFPGGTITGCPKVRCMEIIEELEPVKRNLFYGSCGYLDWRGNLDLNILIRTLLYSKTGDLSSGAKVWGQVGAGIVADSDPEKEWYESLHKAQAQLDALRLAQKLNS
ncbi:para-aminobenzoate synthase component I [Gloeothece citriformis PCC 7424]|uniref:Anthranilate synthase component 1 n=1 Tax=Gloeothece citriformis (strain PCC 7424) TaxID=65393 RepID=B7KCV7_GLOC7|nr:anthranilate synthase component I [Gloeothece citriformis]ACK71658.1 para-aminobenzoate synthase component I [Gloeothece citriformis PCC 7424]